MKHPCRFEHNCSWTKGTTMYHPGSSMGI